jgi:hypothetical protein
MDRSTYENHGPRKHSTQIAITLSQTALSSIELMMWYGPTKPCSIPKFCANAMLVQKIQERLGSVVCCLLPRQDNGTRDAVKQDVGNCCRDESTHVDPCPTTMKRRRNGPGSIVPSLPAATSSLSLLLCIAVNNQIAPPLTNFAAVTTASLSYTLMPPPPADDSKVDGGNVGRLMLMDGAMQSRRQLRALKQQASIQDEKLSKCESAGKDWEHCFYYGTRPTLSASDGQQNDALTKTRSVRVPTW